VQLGFVRQVQTSWKYSVVQNDFEQGTVGPLSSHADCVSFGTFGKSGHF